MSVDPKLEVYLAALDRALGRVPISDRADIILEIKSHVLDSLGKHPEQRAADVLRALGEPEAVANRYLMERGLKPGKSSRSPMIKWLTIGFLGTFGILMASVIFVVSYFTPLISVDENEEHVRILGGLISINGGGRSGDGGDFDVSFQGRKTKFSGSRVLDAAAVDLIDVRFSNGKMEVESSDTDTLTWSCWALGESSGNSPEVQTQDKTATLDLASGAASKCEIELPRGIAARFEGANGKVTLEKPATATEIKMSNGKVDIELDEARSYKFDFKVANGNFDEFKSSDDPQAVAIKVTMDNGRIAKR